MTNDVNRILKNLFIDDALKTIEIVFKQVSMTLTLSNIYLTDFAISKGFDVEIYGDDDSIEIVYPRGKRGIRIDVEADAEEIDRLLDDFNKEMAEKYKEKIQNKTFNETDIRNYINALLDYINSLTDNRANDLIQSIKEPTRGEILEFKVLDAVETVADDEEEDYGE